MKENYNQTFTDLQSVYNAMVMNHFSGNYIFENEWIVWTLNNGICVKATITPMRIGCEGYIGTSFFEGKKETFLTHWHLDTTDEIFQDIFSELTKIERGEIIWARKLSLFGRKGVPLIFEKSELTELKARDASCPKGKKMDLAINRFVNNRGQAQRKTVYRFR